MIGRGILYTAVAGGLVALALYLNRGDRIGDRILLDPSAALRVGPHAHEELGGKCLCDPEEEIRQALRDRAGYARVHLELADRFRARGQDAFAAESYRRAAELEPSSAAAHRGLGLVLARMGRRGEARKALETALELDRRGTETAVSLALLEYADGRFDSARRYLEAALRIAPGDAYARELLARLPRVEWPDRAGPSGRGPGGP